MSRLKWKVAKHLGQLIHNIKMNDAQWLWYYYNIIEDEKEEIEKRNTLVEMLFARLNPSLYQKYSMQKKETISSKVKVTELSKDNFDNIMKDIKQYTEFVYDNDQQKNNDLDEIY